MQGPSCLRPFVSPSPCLQGGRVSLRILVSTRRLIERVGDRIGPLLPRRDVEGVVLFSANAAQLLEGFSHGSDLLLLAPARELPHTSSPCLLVPPSPCLGGREEGPPTRLSGIR